MKARAEEAALEDAARKKALSELSKKTLAAELQVAAGGERAAPAAFSEAAAGAALPPPAPTVPPADAYAEGLTAMEAFSKLSASIGRPKQQRQQQEKVQPPPPSSLSSVQPDDAQYKLYSSGTHNDYGPREGPLLSHDSRGQTVKRLGEIIGSGKGESFGLVDWRLREALLDAKEGGGGGAGALPPASILAGQNRLPNLMEGSDGRIHGGNKEGGGGRGIKGKPPPSGGAAGGVYGTSAKPPGFESAWKESRDKLTMAARNHVSKEKRKEEEEKRLQRESSTMKGGGGGAAAARARRLRNLALRGHSPSRVGGGGGLQQQQDSLSSSSSHFYPGEVFLHEVEDDAEYDESPPFHGDPLGAAPLHLQQQASRPSLEGKISAIEFSKLSPMEKEAVLAAGVEGVEGGEGGSAGMNGEEEGEKGEEQEERIARGDNEAKRQAVGGGTRTGGG